MLYRKPTDHRDVGRVIAVGQLHARWMFVTRVQSEGTSIAYWGRLWKGHKKEWGTAISWNVPAAKEPRVPRPRLPWYCAGSIEVVQEGAQLWRLWIDGKPTTEHSTKREAMAAAQLERAQS